MNTMFKRDYRINFTESFDNGATFHPGSVTVTSPSAHGARYQFMADIDQQGNDSHLVNVHAIFELS